MKKYSFFYIPCYSSMVCEDILFADASQFAHWIFFLSGKQIRHWTRKEKGLSSYDFQKNIRKLRLCYE